MAVVLVSCATARPKPDFAHDIRPILESRCWTCHGSKVQMHGLRLDHREGALKGGGSGVPAIVAGSSSQSLLIKYVAGLDKDIVLASAVDKIEIWDKSKYQQFFESFSPEAFSSLAKQVMNPGGLLP